MRFTFSLTNEQAPVCCSETGTSYLISSDPAFRNREYRFRGDSFLFDGYSHWFRGMPHTLPEGECFTLSIRFLPLTYSAHADGLFSCFRSGSGFELLLEKGGRITVNLGFARFSSIRAHAEAGVWNVVTVVYRGDAGWCDLYVNGVLSNRTQFRRHTVLRFPESCPYIGRRIDDRFYAEGSPFGCFYGYMEWLELNGFAENEARILALHRSVHTGLRDEAAFRDGMPRRDAYVQDRNRPAYHLIPAGKWMNEPHAPFFFDGWYHIFYQGNPHAPVWDHLCWGHLKSRDMVHWQDCLPALIPEKEATAPDGCWSGSAVIGKDGIPRLYFTAGDNRRFPNQAVALVVPMDAALSEWESAPELIQEQDMGWMGEFRDPFVWREEENFYMLVGTGDANNGGGNALLYSSEDGISWKNHGFFVEYDYTQNPEVGHVWELPVLLPLRDENNRIVCHILLLCAAQIENEIVETYYFLGDWNPGTQAFRKHHERARLLDLGKGVFTGPSGFVTPDGRSVVFTIAQGKRKYPEELHAGWAHNGGLPVELSICEGQLSIRPIRELDALRTEELLPSPGMTPNAFLAENPGDTLCLEYTAEGDAASVTLYFGGQRLVISYDRKACRLRVLDNQGQEIGRYRGAIDEADIGSEPISFTCYLDHSMLEVYLNGRKSVSLRNYTDEQRYFQVSGTPISLRLWHMSSAYEQVSVKTAPNGS